MYNKLDPFRVHNSLSFGDVLRQPRNLFRFSISCYGKTQMGILAIPL